MGSASRAAGIALVLTVVVALAGCAPSSVASASAQPEVDAAVVATLPDDFASAYTSQDSESGECLTIVTTLPDRYGLSAAMADDAIDLLRAGAAELGCRSVLRVVRDDGQHLDMSHLAKYLPIQARDGDLVIP